MKMRALWSKTTFLHIFVKDLGRFSHQYIYTDK
jgi:hypothetical protein